MSTERVVRRRYTCSCGFNELVRENESTRAQALIEGEWVPGRWCPHCKKVFTRFVEEKIVPKGCQCGRCGHVYVVDAVKTRTGDVCPVCTFMPIFAQYQPR